MATITQSMLRRFASRSLDVMSRHKDEVAAVAAFQSSLGATAVAYITAFDEAQQAQTSWTRVMNSRSGAVAALNDALQTWLPLLRRDVEGIAGRQFGGSDAVPIDAINDVTNLLSLVDAYLADTAEPVDYLDNMRAELLAAQEAAQAELALSSGSAARVKKLQDQTRSMADAFRVDLITFRAVIRAVLGRTHPDYRQLRTADRTVLAELESEEAVDPAASASLRMASGGIADEPLELDDDIDDPQPAPSSVDTEEVKVAS